MTIGDKNDGIITRAGKVGRILLTQLGMSTLLMVFNLISQAFLNYVTFLALKLGRLVYLHRKLEIFNLDHINSKHLHVLKLLAMHEAWLWHRRLGYASMHILDKLSKHNSIRALSKCSYEEKNQVCSEYIIKLELYINP